ncbi:hypothetical protein JIN85_17070 [Luteolibacter pohnpeiensis]|uniref:Uncharacterized protein n=1 Tax=Luteolibacter pohnpeiensis TaxID=454153 RepID=A0A934VX98_9BACT|nr:hypothetical protein [Luteolibacter pohnpeiensis]MBK1884135.1 hypothetical protein [Luteolibacter pohnpeiensis]
MKRRTVKITRQLTMAKSIVVEIPEGISNDELKSCLYDRCQTYDELETETSVHDMNEENEQIEVEDTKEPASVGFRVTDPDWFEAMREDEIVS